MTKIDAFQRTYCPLCECKTKEINELQREIQKHVHARNSALARVVELQTRLAMDRAESEDRLSGLMQAVDSCGGIPVFAEKMGCQQFIVRQWLASESA